MTAKDFVEKLIEPSPRVVAWHRSKHHNYKPVCATPVNACISNAAGYTMCSGCESDPVLGRAWHPTKAMFARINGTEVAPGTCGDCGGNCDAILAALSLELKVCLREQKVASK